MKTKYIGLLLVLMLVGCKETVKNTGLVGRWKLTETYDDPGDGSGKFMPVNRLRILDIRSNSTVTVIGSGSFLQSDSTYLLKRIDQSRLKFLSRNTTGSSLDVRYKLTDTDLELVYFCIEGCAERYKAIR